MRPLHPDRTERSAPMKGYRRILLLLILCVSLQAAPQQAAAQYSREIACPVTGGNLYFDKLTRKITSCDAGVTRAVIPDTAGGMAVLGIDYMAFAGCDQLAYVRIPQSVTSIGERAFWGCVSLTDVTIPQSVTDIGDAAFGECYGLRSARLPQGIDRLGHSVFWCCNSLTRITIPQGVTSIDGYAFYNCTQLARVALPDSVTLVDRAAFSGCDQLRQVYYAGSAAQWSRVKKATLNSALEEAVVHCGAAAFTEVSSVALNRSTARLRVGETLALRATVNPAHATDRTVTWKSSNPTAISVDNRGVVTAKWAGSARITATADGLSATCTVTAAIPVSRISLNKASISIDVGKTRALKAAVQPSNATDQTVVWKSSNPKVAAVNGKGVVTAKKAGTAQISATAGGRRAVCAVTVTLARPSGFKAASAGYRSVRVRWKKVAGASGYEVYRAASKNGKYKKIATVKKSSATAYTDKTAATGKKYSYKVRAFQTVSGKKQRGAYSATASARAVPAPPSLAFKKASSTSIRLSWKRVAGASGYEVQISTAGKTKGFQRLAVIKKGKATSYTTKKLRRKKTYYCRIRAYRMVSGKKVYGDWSAVQRLKLKR